MNISKTEHEKIRSAIENAEKKTSAEIFAVLTEQSEDYRFIAMFFLSLWIFIVSTALSLSLLWQNIHVELTLFVAAQLLAFIASLLLVQIWPKLQLALTPTKIKHRASHRNAVNQFLAHGIQNTENRTGLLIFVSLNERYAEILVDTAIEEKIGRQHWLDEIANMIEHCKENEISSGYIETINSAGKILAVSYPRGRKKLNELEDKLIII